MNYFNIIVTIYNTELNYLEICLNSIMNQTFADWHCILVDDCSTNLVIPDFLQRFVQQHPKQFTLLRSHCNSGCGMCRDLGLRNAEAQYIWFVDSDDYLEPNALSILYDKLQQFGSVDILSFNFFKIKNSIQSKVIHVYDGFNTNEIINPNIVYNVIKDKIMVWSKVYAQSFLQTKKIQHLPEHWFAEDMYYFLVTYSRATKIVIIDEPVINYRVGHVSMNTNWQIQKKIEDTLNYIMAAYETIKDDHTFIADHFYGFFSFMYKTRLYDMTPPSDRMAEWFKANHQKASIFYKSLFEKNNIK